MIEIRNIAQNMPHELFIKYYDEALKAKQSSINAIAISSFNFEKSEVDSRFVNLKYIIKDKWIFFTNYESPKAQACNKHKQISALLYWDSINTQIRIKGKIRRTSSSFSDEHFAGRQLEKNALAISSNQSRKIDSYEDVLKNFDFAKKNSDLNKRPTYWGGFEFIPYYFEFWQGKDYRLNSRDVFELNNGNWDHYNLQP